jgi:hypothetical protein
LTTAGVKTAVTLLGPQRHPTVDRVLRALDVTGPMAAISAGWQERESDDGELISLLGGHVTNLRLYARWMQVLNDDPEFARAEREHRGVLDELQQLYQVQLDHAVRATAEVAQRADGNPRIGAMAVDDALAVVRQIDDTHLTRVRELHSAFYGAWAPHEREPIVRHREEVRTALSGVGCLVVTGGHVGDLSRVMHLFNLAPELPPRVIAWSAGAMSLATRIVLFHDRAAHGPAQTEVYDEGLGVVPGLLPLPHARRRLRTDDPVRMSLLARRMAPAQCLVLDDGVTVDLGTAGTLPIGARVVGLDGYITEVAA